MESKYGAKIEIYAKDLKNFWKMIAKGNFSNVNLEVSREGLLCTFETPQGIVTKVIKNLLIIK